MAGERIRRDILGAATRDIQRDCRGIAPAFFCKRPLAADRLTTTTHRAQGRSYRKRPLAADRLATTTHRAQGRSYRKRPLAADRLTTTTHRAQGRSYSKRPLAADRLTTTTHRAQGRSYRKRPLAADRLTTTTHRAQGRSYRKRPLAADRLAITTHRAQGRSYRKRPLAADRLATTTHRAQGRSYSNSRSVPTRQSRLKCHYQLMNNFSKPRSRALRKGRYSQKNGIYFVTSVTNQRIPWFQVPEFAQTICKNIEQPACMADAELLCWVVMPDHIHLLLQLSEAPLGRVINRLKSQTAIKLNRKIGRTGRFWSPGFHDHALRHEESIIGIARYIVANPLRARLVESVGDYPYWNSVYL